MSDAGAGPQRTLVRGAGCVLAAWWCLGLAHIAWLPPWEGFDETANYSYIQQLVDTGRVPVRDEGRLSLDILRYAERGPMPASQPYPSTYADFFAQPQDVQERLRAFVHEPPADARRFAPTVLWNWEVQQPPTYYAVMAPVYVATRARSLIQHLASLRVASYGLAWMALALTAWTFARRLNRAADRLVCAWGLVGVSLWPLLFPTWFLQMARLGNDSLAALFASVIFVMVYTRASKPLSCASAIPLGVVVGAACLTKGLFLPVVPGLIGWLAIRAWRSPQPDVRSRQLVYVAGVALLVAAIAARWYVNNLSTFHPVVSVRQSGPSLLDRINGDLPARALRGFAASVATVAWSGTWSLVRPRYVWLVPPAALVLLIAAAYLRSLRRVSITDVRWTPAWLVTPLLVGLAFAVVLLRAVAGNMGNNAGRYLHFLVAPAAFGLGLGLGSAWTSSILRRTFAGLIAYVILFDAAISWAQLLFFAGLLRKSPAKFYEAAAPLPSGLGVPEALTRLTVFAYPTVGLVCAVAGAMLACIGFRAMWRAIQILGPIEGS